MFYLLHTDFYCLQFVKLMWIYNVKNDYGKNVADTSVRYPRWANGVGWIIAILPIIPIPCAMMYTLLRKNGTLLQVQLISCFHFNYEENAQKY